MSEFREETDCENETLSTPESLQAPSEQDIQNNVARPASWHADAYRNFCIFSALFSANHAAGLACLALATARLGSIGAWQSSILYTTYTFSAITVSTWVVLRMGSKKAASTGMWLFCAYVGCFFLAAVFPDVSSGLSYIGAAVGGIGAGIAWTAQGVYFSQAAEAHAAASSSALTKATSELAGVFAAMVLAAETLFDTLSTALVRHFHVPWSIVFATYVMFAIAATIAMRMVFEYPNHPARTVNLLFKSLSSIGMHLSDSKMKYMMGFNAAFGFAGAFLNSFVSGEVVPAALGDSALIGVLVALHGIIASIFSLVFARLAQTQFGKTPIIVVGAFALAFVAIPFLMKPDFADWTLAMVVTVYACEGIGRAVFEGTWRATFADFFPQHREEAFANMILQYGLASAAAYLLSNRFYCFFPSTFCYEYEDGSMHDFRVLALMVVTFSFVAILCFLRARFLFISEDQSSHSRGSAVAVAAPIASEVELPVYTYKSLGAVNT